VRLAWQTGKFDKAVFLLGTNNRWCFRPNEGGRQSHRDHLRGRRGSW